MKVAISTRSFGADPGALPRLRAAGIEPIMNPYGRKLEPAETIKLLDGACGLIAGTERLDASVFEKTPSLKVISRVGTGMDSVDIAAARERGILVFNTPQAPALAVAELTIGQMLSLLRNTREADSAVRAGRWSAPMGRQLTGRTVGIVGFGRIGREVARLLSPFRPKLSVHDPLVSSDDVAQAGATASGLDELLRTSDIVTLHLALTDSTRHLLNATRLGMMKKGALLLNLARGGLIDEAALLTALKSGQIGAAALDVFETEPYNGPLTGLNNVLLTPHAASATEESRLRMESEAVENLLEGLKRAGMALGGKA